MWQLHKAEHVCDLVLFTSLKITTKCHVFPFKRSWLNSLNTYTASHPINNPFCFYPRIDSPPSFPQRTRFWDSVIKGDHWRRRIIHNIPPFVESDRRHTYGGYRVLPSRQFLIQCPLSRHFSPQFAPRAVCGISITDQRWPGKYSNDSFIVCRISTEFLSRL